MYATLMKLDRLLLQLTIRNTSMTTFVFIYHQLVDGIIFLNVSFSREKTTTCDAGEVA